MASGCERMSCVFGFGGIRHFLGVLESLALFPSSSYYRGQICTYIR
jgi:hypothetical protein